MMKHLNTKYEVVVRNYHEDYKNFQSLNLPFKDMDIQEYIDKVNSINLDKFSILDMQAEFSGQRGCNWEDQGCWEEGSDLVNLLTDYVPKQTQD